MTVLAQSCSAPATWPEAIVWCVGMVALAWMIRGVLG